MPSPSSFTMNSFITKGWKVLKIPLDLDETLQCDPCLTWDTPPHQSPSLPPYTLPMHGKDTWLG